MAAIKAVPDQKPDKKIGKKKAKSEIAFPYYNLTSAIEVAQVIHDRAGGRCSREQLAGFLKYSGLNNGSFLTRVAATKMFGLIEPDGNQLRVSARGRAIIAPVTPELAESAKVEAFLAVPLFQRIYDELRGTNVPEEAGLRNLIETSFGVVKARVAPTVRIMKESAEQAGFFKVAANKMVLPPTASGSPKKPAPLPDPPGRPETRHHGGGGGGDDGQGIHPALAGLLRGLPAAGSPLSEKRRTALVDAFKNAVAFLYPEDDDDGMSHSLTMK